MLEQVLQALPPELAQRVVSAGFDQGRLTVGVIGAAWAARLRYQAEALRVRVGDALGLTIRQVRIRVVPPPP